MEKSESQSNYFKGALSAELNIAEVIQLAGRNMKSGMLTLYSDNGDAKIYFSGGEIVNASYKQIKGIDALVEMLGWKRGQFTFQDGLTANERNVGCDYTAALLNATKKRDERIHSSDVNTISQAGEETLMNPLREQLEDFLKVEGVTMVVVVGRDGFIIEAAAVSNQSIDEVGAVVSTGMGSSESMGTDLGVGNMNQGMLEYENGIIFIRAVGSDAIFILVSTTNVNLGMVRLQIKKRIATIEAAL